MSQGPWRHHAEIIMEYARRYPRCRVFVETGTGEVAETTGKMASVFDLVFTIDIDPVNFEYASKKFADNPFVFPICADSEDYIPRFVGAVGSPCLFLLDAHWDHDSPRRRGRRDTPIQAELEVILKNPLHVVLIDDARFFLDEGLRDPEYPSYEWVQEIAMVHGFDCSVADDVIRLVHP